MKKRKRSIISANADVKRSLAVARRKDIKASLFKGNCIDLMSKIATGSVDLVVTSPPYCMGKEYEHEDSVEEFYEAHRLLLPEVVRITKPGGSICWQVGSHVSDSTVYPLDFAVFSIMQSLKDVALRNRIIWTFGHGFHMSKRFSGRYETVLWFTKSDKYHFNLDAVRVPQKYPGKRHYRGPDKGNFSCNPLGKNPSDVWEIPNVKGNHVEKTEHPCQFPVALVQRLVRALCPEGGLVFDPFMGSGSTGVACLLEKRRFLGAELEPKYCEIAMKRLRETHLGKGAIRPLDRDIYRPSPSSPLAIVPEHFSWTGNKVN